MGELNCDFFSTGIYSVPDAAHLTGVSAGRIRRWLRGYSFRSRNKEYHSAPLWHGQLEPIDNALALGFLDLIEIKFVDAFLQAGVSWFMLRKAHERASQLFNQSHPFGTQRFATDGREIFVELHEQTGEATLMEIVRKQKVFPQIVRPFLNELEFGDGDVLVRWRPSTSRRLVVLDPTRSFGRPIVLPKAVPTEMLARAVRASGWWPKSAAGMECPPTRSKMQSSLKTNSLHEVFPR